MCGILSQCGPAPVDRQLFVGALQRLQSRGPDGQGCWFSDDGRVALGHRRLAIVDPVGGHQPLEDGLVAVVNGEFYGHALIRAQLMARGHHFHSHSDSEILLHLYRQYGLACLEQLQGEFAFVLFDPEQELLLAARDRFGIKPLVYHHRDGQLSIASKVAGLEGLGHRPRWDTASFYRASCTQYVGPEETLFQSVRQLPPGHFLRWQAGSLEIRPYWQLPRRCPEAQDGESDWPEQLAQHLDESVRARLPAQAVACQLSGGIDSASVLALAEQACAEVEAFHISFPGSPLDEQALAAQVAELRGVPLRVLALDSQQLLAALRPAVLASEGLAINAHLSAKYLLQREIHARGYKVCLTGEGADEVLYGYPHFRIDLNPERAEDIYRQNPASQGIMVGGDEGISTAGLQAVLGHCPQFLKAKAALGLRIQSLLRPEFLAAFRERDCYLEMLTGCDWQGRSQLEQSALLWNQSALANYILHTLGDGCEMAHSVEGRLPFLDTSLCEFLARVPLDWLIRHDQEKFVLRQAMADLLPRALLERRKHPFMAPALEGLYDHLEALALEVDHPFVARPALLERLHTLRQAGATETHLWQPPLLWILSSYYLEQSLSR